MSISMVKRQDTINRQQQISLIRLYCPNYSNKEIGDILNGLDQVIEYGLETNQKIKFGKLFTIKGIVRPARKHYNGINGTKSDPYVMLPKRLRFKFTALQKLKDIEDSYKDED